MTRNKLEKKIEKKDKQILSHAAVMDTPPLNKA